jgi:hypothetical protein
MRTKSLILSLLVTGLAGHAAAAQAIKPATPAMKHPAAAANGGDQALIASAMSAAPPAIAVKATIVDMGAKGMRVVRKGSNGFTCMPDNPTTPGPDPMCGDENAMNWATALMNHKEPDLQKVGFLYMLAGGTDASNTDPHVMVVGNQEILTHYPTSPEPDTTQPYVMWAGTPYAHLMIPVK